MRSTLRSTLRRRTITAAAGTAVLLAVGGGATAAFAASGDSTPAASTASCTAPHLGAILRGGTHGALRADLKKLRAEPKDQRAAERKAIREHALSGEYGARAERLAHIVAGSAAKGHGWAASLPAALKTDLKALRGLEAKSDARKAKAQEIVQKAVAGDYGTAIQTRAKAVQTRVQARCAAKQG